MNTPNLNQKVRGLMTMMPVGDTSATTVYLWLDARAMNLYGVITALAETMTSSWKGNTRNRLWERKTARLLSNNNSVSLVSKVVFPIPTQNIGVYAIQGFRKKKAMGA